MAKATNKAAGATPKEEASSTETTERAQGD
jgi:hypothetical protein